jgi:hypothetical protein
MGGINEQIHEICKEQDKFSDRIDNVIKMQEDVSSYIVNLNNENFQKNLLKYRENYANSPASSLKKKFVMTESESEPDAIKFKTANLDQLLEKKHFTTKINK